MPKHTCPYPEIFFSYNIVNNIFDEGKELSDQFVSDVKIINRNYC